MNHEVENCIGLPRLEKQNKLPSIRRKKGQVFCTAVKTSLVGMPATYPRKLEFKCWLHFPFQLPANEHPGGWEEMAQGLEGILATHMRRLAEF